LSGYSPLSGGDEIIEDGITLIEPDQEEKVTRPGDTTTNPCIGKYYYKQEGAVVFPTGEPAEEGDPPDTEAFYASRRDIMRKGSTIGPGLVPPQAQFFEGIALLGQELDRLRMFIELAQLDGNLYADALRKAQIECSKRCLKKVCETPVPCRGVVSMRHLTIDYEWEEEVTREYIRRAVEAGKPPTGPSFNKSPDYFKKPPPKGGFRPSRDRNGPPMVLVWQMYEVTCECKCEGETSLQVMAVWLKHEKEKWIPKYDFSGQIDHYEKYDPMTNSTWMKSTEEYAQEFK